MQISASFVLVHARLDRKRYNFESLQFLFTLAF